MVRDLSENATGTLLPWELSDLSDCGEAEILGAPGSWPKNYNSPNACTPNAQQIVCALGINDPEDSEELMRVQLDARRIVAAVNFTQNLPLEMLESMAEEPLSPTSAQGAAQNGYYDDED